MSQLKIKNGNNWESIPAGGIGVPSGGSSGEFLKKSSSVDYATEWSDLPSPRRYRINIATQTTQPSGNTGVVAQISMGEAPSNEVTVSNNHIGFNTNGVALIIANPKGQCITSNYRLWAQIIMDEAVVSDCLIPGSSNAYISTTFVSLVNVDTTTDIYFYARSNFKYNEGFDTTPSTIDVIML